MKSKKVFKKKLVDFIKDESGNMSRDKVLKIGLGTISALGMLSAFSSEAVAGHTSNAAYIDTWPAAHDCAHGSHASHSSY